jgi:hypothetical protein
VNPITSAIVVALAAAGATLLREFSFGWLISDPGNIGRTLA